MVLLPYFLLYNINIMKKTLSSYKPKTITQEYSTKNLGVVQDQTNTKQQEKDDLENKILDLKQQNQQMLEQLQAIDIDENEIKKVNDNRNIFQKFLNLKENQGLIMGTLELLNRPAEALQGMLSASYTGQNVLQSMYKGLHGDKEYTLTDLGIKSDNPIVNGVMNLGFEIMADPFNFIDLPVGSFSKTAKQVLSKANSKIALWASKSQQTQEMYNAVKSLANRAVDGFKKTFGVWKDKSHNFFSNDNASLKTLINNNIQELAKQNTNLYSGINDLGNSIFKEWNNYSKEIQDDIITTLELGDDFKIKVSDITKRTDANDLLNNKLSVFVSRYIESSYLHGETYSNLITKLLDEGKYLEAVPKTLDELKGGEIYTAVRDIMEYALKFDNSYSKNIDMDTLIKVDKASKPTLTPSGAMKDGLGNEIKNKYNWTQGFEISLTQQGREILNKYFSYIQRNKLIKASMQGANITATKKMLTDFITQGKVTINSNDVRQIEDLEQIVNSYKQFYGKDLELIGYKEPNGFITYKFAPNKESYNYIKNLDRQLDNINNNIANITNKLNPWRELKSNKDLLQTAHDTQYDNFLKQLEASPEVFIPKDDIEAQKQLKYFQEELYKPYQKIVERRAKNPDDYRFITPPHRADKLSFSLGQIGFKNFIKNSDYYMNKEAVKFFDRLHLKFNFEKANIRGNNYYIPLELDFAKMTDNQKFNVISYYVERKIINVNDFKNFGIYTFKDFMKADWSTILKQNGINYISINLSDKHDFKNFVNISEWITQDYVLESDDIALYIAEAIDNIYVGNMTSMKTFNNIKNTLSKETAYQFVKNNVDVLTEQGKEVIKSIEKNRKNIETFNKKMGTYASKYDIQQLETLEDVYKNGTYDYHTMNKANERLKNIREEFPHRTNEILEDSIKNKIDISTKLNDTKHLIETDIVKIDVNLLRYEEIFNKVGYDPTEVRINQSTIDLLNSFTDGCYIYRNNSGHIIYSDVKPPHLSQNEFAKLDSYAKNLLITRENKLLELSDIRYKINNINEEIALEDAILEINRNPDIEYSRDGLIKRRELEFARWNNIITENMLANLYPQFKNKNFDIAVKEVEKELTQSTKRIAKLETEIANLELAVKRNNKLSVKEVNNKVKEFDKNISELTTTIKENKAQLKKEKAQLKKDKAKQVVDEGTQEIIDTYNSYLVDNKQERELLNADIDKLLTEATTSTERSGYINSIVDKINELEELYSGETSTIPNWISDEFKKLYKEYKDGNDELWDELQSMFNKEVENIPGYNDIKKYIQFDETNNKYYVDDDVIGDNIIFKQVDKKDYKINMQEYYKFVKQTIKDIPNIKNYSLSKTTNSIYLNDGTIRISDHLPPNTNYKFIEETVDDIKFNIVFKRTTTKEIKDINKQYNNFIKDLKPSVKQPNKDYIKAEKELNDLQKKFDETPDYIEKEIEQPTTLSDKKERLQRIGDLNSLKGNSWQNIKTTLIDFKTWIPKDEIEKFIAKVDDFRIKYSDQGVEYLDDDFIDGLNNSYDEFDEYADLLKDDDIGNTKIPFDETEEFDNLVREFVNDVKVKYLKKSSPEDLKPIKEIIKEPNPAKKELQKLLKDKQKELSKINKEISIVVNNTDVGITNANIDLITNNIDELETKLADIKNKKMKLENELVFNETYAQQAKNELDRLRTYKDNQINKQQFIQNKLDDLKATNNPAFEDVPVKSNILECEEFVNDPNWVPCDGLSQADLYYKNNQYIQPMMQNLDDLYKLLSWDKFLGQIPDDVKTALNRLPDNLQQNIERLAGVQMTIQGGIGRLYKEIFGVDMDKWNVQGYLRHMFSPEYASLNAVLNTVEGKLTTTGSQLFGRNLKKIGIHREYQGSAYNINKAFGTELFNTNPVEATAIALEILPNSFSLGGVFKNMFDRGVLKEVSLIDSKDLLKTLNIVEDDMITKIDELSKVKNLTPHQHTLLRDYQKTIDDITTYKNITKQQKELMDQYTKVDVKNRKIEEEITYFKNQRRQLEKTFDTNKTTSTEIELQQFQKQLDEIDNKIKQLEISKQNVEIPKDIMEKNKLLEHELENIKHNLASHINKNFVENDGWLHNNEMFGKEYTWLRKEMVNQIQNQFEFLKKAMSEENLLTSNWGIEFDNFINKLENGSHFAIHKGVYEAIKKYGIRATSKNEMGQIWSTIQKYITIPWKKISVLSVGFHLRNLFTNYTNAYLAGINPIDLHKGMLVAQKELKAFEGFLKNLDTELLKGTYRTAQEQIDLIARMAKSDPNGMIFMDYMDMCRKGIIGNNQFSSDILELMKKIKNSALGRKENLMYVSKYDVVNKTKDSIRKLMEQSFKISKHMDDWSKISMYRLVKDNPKYQKLAEEMGFNASDQLIQKLANGEITQEVFDKAVRSENAERFVKFTLFDYNNLTYAEETYMKALFPFYTWARKNLEFQLRNIGKNSKRYLRLYNAMQGWRNGVVLDKDNEQEFHENYIPIWNEDGKITYIKFGLPFDEVDRILDGSGIVNSLSPIIKTPLEMITGYDFFTRKQFNTNGVLPGFGLGLNNILGTFNTVQKMIFQDYAPTYEEKKLAGLIGKKLMDAVNISKNVLTLFSASRDDSLINSIGGLLPSVFSQNDIAISQYYNAKERNQQLQDAINYYAGINK